MKVGYTPMETYQMFRSLRREVFSYFNYDLPLSFGVRDPKTGIFNEGDIAHCDFSDEPDKPWHFMDRVNEYASGIRVNATFLPYLYEDEMICVLLHELTHATAGFKAEHGLMWQQHAREVGAVPESHFLVRNWQKMRIFEKGNIHYNWAIRQEGPTMDVFAGSL